MKVETVPYVYPNVAITLSWDDAQHLYHMLLEAKSYASECGEFTDVHDEFIQRLGEVVFND